MKTSTLKVLPVTGLNGIDLRCGGHKSRDAGVCAMEAVAWLAGERHSDHPACACPVMGQFFRQWNDRLKSDAERNRLLKPLLPLLIGTRANPAIEEQRKEMLFDFVARTATPATLSLAGLDAAAEMLRAEPTWENLYKARDMAWAARAAATDRLRKKIAASAASAAIDAIAASAASAASAAIAAIAASAASAAIDAIDAIDASAAIAAIDAIAVEKISAAYRDGGYPAARKKTAEIVRPIIEEKFAPLRSALELAAADLVRKMAALSEAPKKVKGRK